MTHGEGFAHELFYRVRIYGVAVGMATEFTNVTTLQRNKQHACDMEYMYMYMCLDLIDWEWPVNETMAYHLL